MKVLKVILLIVLVVVAIALIAALFVKKEMGSSRQVIINRPKDDVFRYIRYLKNQEVYSKWYKIDPAMKKSYTGTDGTIGFTTAWDSEKKEAGKGEQEIKKISEGQQIDYEIRFIKPFASTAFLALNTEEVSPTQTKVTWSFKGNMSYPFNLFRLFVNVEEKIGDDLQVGLNTLKEVLEKQ